MSTEVFCWVLLAVSVLIFISLLGVGGKAGNALGGIFFGLMGANAYVFPFLLFFLTIFVMVNRGNRRAYVQTAAAAGLFIVVCGIMELMAENWHGSYELSDYFEVGSQYHAGGGVIGGAIAILFCPTIGVVGAYIVLIMAGFLLLALFTQKALFVTAGKKSHEAIKEKKEASRARREEEKARREEEKAQRRAEERRLREEEDEKRKTERRRAGKADAAAGAREDPDGLSASFFRRSGKNPSDGLSVSRDLFGETRKGALAKPEKRSVRRSAGKVVFGKLEGDVPGEENAPDTTFDKAAGKKRVVSSGSFLRMPALEETSEAEIGRAHV